MHVVKTQYSKLVISNEVGQLAHSLRFRPPVVLAEDDGEMRRLLNEALLEEGFDVVKTGSGLALFDELRRRKSRDELPALIVSDIRMPGQNGLEMLRIVRSWGWTVPFVLITSFGDDDTVREANELGATCILSKPFDLDDLCAMAKFLTDRNELADPWLDLGTAG